MNGELAIEIQELTKTFGKQEALRGLSLTVPQGSICGFLGRNGAGKTTTLKLLLGMLRPSGGEAWVFGNSIRDERQSLAIRQRVGFVSERKGLYPYMKVSEVIRFTRPFFPKWSSELEAKYMKAFDLDPEKKIPKLSKGNLTKLNLLLSLARRADLLVLDEPTDGLDPAMIEDVLQALVTSAAEQGTTIFFSSHQLHEVEQIADRVVLIEGGRTVIEDSLDELRANYRRVVIVFSENADSAEPHLRRMGSFTREGRTFSLLVRSDAEAVVAQARALGAISAEAQPVSLKEIFLRTVRNN